MRAIAWCVVVLLVLLSLFGFGAGVYLDRQLRTDEAKRVEGAALAARRSAPIQAAEALAHLRSYRDASDFGFWLGLGAGSLAILSFMILAATHPRRRRDDAVDDDPDDNQTQRFQRRF
jgi:hypothetical protein